MPTNFDLAEAAINFTAGTEATWNAFVLPIPENVVVYTVDTKKFKKGDGNHRFSELEDGPSIAGIASGEETVVNVLTQLEAGDEDSIISINNEIYDASATKLTTLVTRLNALANSNTVQTANMDAAELQFGLVNSGITTSDNGKLAVVIGHDMSAGVLPDTLSVQAPVNPINIRSFDFYSDKACMNKVTDMYHSSTYYANVHVQHDTADIDNVTIQLTETNDYVTVEHVERGLFKIVIGKPVTDGTVQFTTTATYNTDTVSVDKSLNIHAYVPIIVAICGGSGDDVFVGVVTDSDNNIICVGYTLSEGLGGTTYGDAIIVKFDPALNIIAKKRYGGSSNDQFSSASVDSLGNIYVTGSTNSEGSGGYDVFIIKFDSSLNILIRKVYGGTGNEYFRSSCIDSNGNIICVGWTNSEGTGSPTYANALVVKFDSSLNILIQKYINGATEDMFYNVAVDSSDNIICVGSTDSGLTSDHALVIKFDPSLNILIQKKYGSSISGGSYFYGVTVDSSDNIYCVGHTSSEGSGDYDGLVVKFNSSLNIIARKHYGGTNDDKFRDIKIDSQDNIVCGGYTSSEGLGSTTYANTLVVKFDSSLNLLLSKMYSGSNTDNFTNINIDSNNDIICVGKTQSMGYGGSDALVVKFPKNITPGSFVGTTFTDFILSDPSELVIDNSALTLSVTTLNSANSALTLADSTLTLANSDLNLEKDFIYV